MVKRYTTEYRDGRNDEWCADPNYIAVTWDAAVSHATFLQKFYGAENVRVVPAKCRNVIEAL